MVGGSRKTGIVLLVALVVLSACDQPFPTQRDAAEVSLLLDLTSFVVRSTTEGVPAVQPSSYGASGTFTAVETGTGVAVVFDWYASIDESSFSIDSMKTILLAPGYYDFYLDLELGGHRYAGKAETCFIEEGENGVTMKVAPVIGTVSITASVEELSSLRFMYPANELGAMDDPVLYIGIDGGAPTVCRFDRQSGVGDVFVGVDSGDHVIVLELFDGVFQIARSVPSQESIYVDPGNDLEMDLVPLSGEMVLSLDMMRSRASFSFAIPGEIIDEAGSAENLRAVLKVSGDSTGFHEVDLDVVGSGNVYITETFLPDMTYDVLDLSLEFSDESTSDLLGICVLADLVLSDLEQSMTWMLELRRRSAVTGSLLGVVAINVYYTGGTPVAGAAVYVDGTFTGLTGAGFGTEGYLKVLLRPGSHSLHATVPGYSGYAYTSVAPLEIEMIDINLAEVNIGF